MCYPSGEFTTPFKSYSPLGGRNLSANIEANSSIKDQKSLINSEILPTDKDITTELNKENEEEDNPTKATERGEKVFPEGTKSENYA